MQAKRRQVGDANPRRADAVDRGLKEGELANRSQVVHANQHAALGEVGGPAANGSRADLKLDSNFAGQAIVLPAISDFALAQEDRHSHLELLGKRADALAVLLYRLDMRIGAGRGVADFGCAFGHRVGKP